MRAALDQADTQLQKAVSDLARATKRVQDLNKRIPELRRVRDSLAALLGEKVRDPSAIRPVQLAVGPTLPDYARYARPKEVSEVSADDDLLPDAEGNEVLP
jgi:hypothetical protein